MPTAITVKEIAVQVDQTPLSADVEFWAGPKGLLDANVPTLSTAADATLPDGSYQFAYTLITPLGESRLSDLSLAKVIATPGTDNLKILVTLPALATFDLGGSSLKVTAAAGVNVYVYFDDGVNPVKYRLCNFAAPLATTILGTNYSYTLSTTSATSASHTAVMLNDPGGKDFADIGQQLTTFDANNLIEAATGTETIGAAAPEYLAVDVVNNTGGTITTIKAYIIQNQPETANGALAYESCAIYDTTGVAWNTYAMLSITATPYVTLGTTVTNGSTVPLYFRYQLPVGRQIGTVSTPIAVSCEVV